MKKLLIATGTCLLVLLSGCKNNRTDDDNLEKLLERQAVRQEVQQQSLEQMERLKIPWPHRKNLCWTKEIPKTCRSVSWKITNSSLLIN
jgi:hypothetical protein